MRAGLLGLNLTPREEELADYILSNKSMRDGKICKRLGLRFKNYMNIRNGLYDKVIKSKGR